MEKCIVPEILNQPVQQHHLFLILVTVSQLGWKGQAGYWSRIKHSSNQRASASWFHIISKSPTRYSHHRHHLSVFTALQTNCHSAAWSLFNSSDTHWETVCTLLESFIFLAGNQVGFTWILNPCIIPFFPPLSFFPHCVKASFICHISSLFKGTRLNKLINRAAQGFISQGCVLLLLTGKSCN